MGTLIIDDLVAEQDRLETILEGLDDEAWHAPSAAAGWTIADVVLHLAQTEEAVVTSAAAGAVGGAGPAAAPAGPAGDGGPAGADGGGTWRAEGLTLDEAVDRRVRAERAAPVLVFDRWRVARRAAVTALRQADPQRPLPWAAAPLKPATLATTRLAEHWAHGLDITGPLSLPFPDTDRLRHIAWLGHASLPYAFAFAGQEPHAVFCELTAPDGATWRYGPTHADSTITGPAGAFCRVGARRLSPDESGLIALGPHAVAALRVLRNYAG